MQFKLRSLYHSRLLLLFTVSGLLIYLALRLLLTALNTHQATLFFDDWQTKQVLPSQQAWSVAKEAMLKAEAWSPVQDAFLQEKLGKVYEWNTYAEAFGDLKVNGDRNLALQAYRKQAELTALWPNAWLNVMAIKIQLNEYDAEFSNAMIQAESSAKGQPKAVYRLAEIGIQAWSNLSRPQKSNVLKVIGLSISQSQLNERKLKFLLDERGLLPIFCYYSKVSNIKIYDTCY